MLAASLVIKSQSVVFDKRSPSEGYIRGDVNFTDDSLLHFREFVTTQPETQRLSYTYHYQRADGALVFRYDDSPHYPDLPNAPHHKHDGDETNVVPSSAPDLAVVLKEIESHIPVE